MKKRGNERFQCCDQYMQLTTILFFQHRSNVKDIAAGNLANSTIHLDSKGGNLANSTIPPKDICVENTFLSLLLGHPEINMRWSRL